MSSCCRGSAGFLKDLRGLQFLRMVPGISSLSIRSLGFTLKGSIRVPVKGSTGLHKGLLRDLQGFIRV